MSVVDLITLICKHVPQYLLRYIDRLDEIQVTLKAGKHRNGLQCSREPEQVLKEVKLRVVHPVDV